MCDWEVLGAQKRVATVSVNEQMAMTITTARHPHSLTPRSLISDNFIKPLPAIPLSADYTTPV
jgi:hypothetical protein